MKHLTSLTALLASLWVLYAWYDAFIELGRQVTLMPGDVSTRVS